MGKLVEIIHEEPAPDQHMINININIPEGDKPSEIAMEILMALPVLELPITCLPKEDGSGVRITVYLEGPSGLAEEMKSDVHHIVDDVLDRLKVNNEPS